MIITKDTAGLWTDGRYFTQAEEELKGTEIELMRLRQPGVMDPIPYLIEHTPEGGICGFDGRVVSTADAKTIAAGLEKKHASIVMKDDLAGMVWGDKRPAMPDSQVYILKKKYTGETAAERIARTRQAMKDAGADALVLTHLEDPCWLLNLRADDIACTPVAYAFVLMTARKVTYYIDKKKVSDEVRTYLHDNGVTVKPYNGLESDLAALHDKTVWADLRHLSAALYACLDTSNRILNADSPIVLFRAVKNAAEIRCMHASQIKDGVAMVKFLCWLKENAGSPDLSELSAAAYLDARRSEQPDFIELSFPTISAYGSNAAMMHYQATEKKYKKCRGKGFLLVDSGGTYKDGTTDVTRTIALGPLSAEEKMLYTLVLKGHLDLMDARFLHGSIGNNLDILARRPLWNLNIDYQCGTGHGVGHVLSVHEGPQAIRWGVPTKSRPSAVLEAGMIVTDEPGVYLPHKLGIRIENDLLVVKDTRNFYGQWLKFEPMTLVPYDRDAIDPKYLDDHELEQLNQYHKLVWEKLSPKLKGKEKAWLKQAVAEIKR